MEEGVITIIDISSGKAVYNSRISGTKTIALNLAKGLYLMKVTTKEQSKQFKISKQ